MQKRVSTTPESVALLTTFGVKSSGESLENTIKLIKTKNFEQTLQASKV